MTFHERTRDYYEEARQEAGQAYSHFLRSMSDSERLQCLERYLEETRELTVRSSPTPEWEDDLESGGLKYIESDESAGDAHLVYLSQKAVKHKETRQRCGCDSNTNCSTRRWGMSYITVDYNYGVGRGKYDVIVYLRKYGRDYYGGRSWDFFVESPNGYRLFQSSRLFGPGSPGRGGPFWNGSNDTGGASPGTLGMAFYVPGSSELVGWRRWYFDNEDWDGMGSEWLHCGKDFDFWFRDLRAE